MFVRNNNRGAEEMRDLRSSRISRRQVIKTAAATAVATGFGAMLPKPLYAATATPETTKAMLGFIALTDAAPLIVAKEKGFFAKYGMPDVEVVKQASWGTTRDNLVLGSAGNGIDGAHILTPMPYLISTGKVTQNNVPTPMYILARLNLDSQCISVGAEYAALKLGLDAEAVQGGAREEKSRGQPVKAAMTFPGGTHDLLDSLLARCRRHRSGQGHRNDRRAAAADGREHESRHHGLLLRRRALERATQESEDRLHRDQHRRAVEQASGEILRDARGLGRQTSQAATALLMAVQDAQHVVRQARESRGGGADRFETLRGSTRPSPTSSDRLEGQVRLRHRQGRRRTVRTS